MHRAPLPLESLPKAPTGSEDGDKWGFVTYANAWEIGFHTDGTFNSGRSSLRSDPFERVPVLRARRLDQQEHDRPAIPMGLAITKPENLAPDEIITDFTGFKGNYPKLKLSQIKAERNMFLTPTGGSAINKS